MSEIHDRIVSLIESHTDNCVLHKAARVLATEFANCKWRQGLEDARASAIDVEKSARLILKRQILHLYSHRRAFTPLERAYLSRLAKLVAKL